MKNLKFKTQNCGIATRYLLILIFIFLILSSFSLAIADSLWDKESTSPYTTQRAYKVGDIINIIIMESTSAKNIAGTKTDTKDDLGAKFTHTIQRLAPVIGANNQLAGNVSNSFSGQGQTQRSSNVSARIAAWVTEVMPNGNLAIKGNHKMEVNDEIQEITVTGVIRPQDVSGANTLFSYQVANAQLAVKGTGVVAETESPGWLTRIFNWLF